MLSLEDFKARYNIHEKFGFLPYPRPMECIESEPFKSSWEKLVKEIPKYTSNEQQGQLIEMLHAMPVLDANVIIKEGLLSCQRAYVVLGFLAHFYVWGEFPTKIRDRIPECIAKPWILISEHLGLKPVLSHAGVVLWNWKYHDPSLEKDPSNLE